MSGGGAGSAGWHGAERGETLSALDDQCRAAAGPGGAHLLPDRLLMVKDLDGARLHKALGRLNGLGRGAALTFRIPPAGRFDAALVPVGPAGQARERLGSGSG